MKQQRFDRTYIKDYKETPEGYLTFTDVPITRAGVFPYRRNDGAVSYEAKLPDEILSAHTVSTAQSKAVTDDHPSGLVTLDNHKDLARGLSHTDARVDGDKLLVSFTVTDSALIDKIKNGKREVSIGFLSDIKQESGVYDGVTYDSVQRNIEINHIAIVDKGRAGSEIGIRADSAAWQIEEGGQIMPTYKIDSKDYEVDPVVKAHLEAQQARLDAAEMKAKEIDALQGRVDAYEATIATKDKEIADLQSKQISQDELDQKIAERIALVESAKSFLGDSYDFTGKSDRAVKEAVITLVQPEFKADSKTDDYVDAFYDGAIAKISSEGFKSTGVNTMYTGDAAGVGAADKETQKKIEEMKNKRLNMREGGK